MQKYAHNNQYEEKMSTKKRDSTTYLARSWKYSLEPLIIEEVGPENP